MSSESTFYTDGANSNMSGSKVDGNGNTSNDTSFGKTKYAPSFSGIAWATDSTLQTGAASSKVTAFGTTLYSWSIYDMYLRFDTSSLGDDEEITGVQLVLEPTSKFNNTGGGEDFERVRIYAGLTGGSDRPTFSSPPDVAFSGVGTPTDANWTCEDFDGCFGSNCLNDGATEVGSFTHSDMTTGSRNSIKLTGGSLNDWINRTGYTYIYLVHETWRGGDGSGGVGTAYCNNATGAAPYTATGVSKAIGLTWTGGTSGDGPHLIINQGKTRYQMII